METIKSTFLDAYIPIDRRQALIQSRELPVESSGTVLFADISGFTELTARFSSAHGDNRGADEITQYLNTIYEAIVREIHNYQGSVINFAGDAITCWFDGDEGRRALAAGDLIHKSVANLARDNNIDIDIKVIIAHGGAFRFIVGDPKIQLLDLLAGKTIESVIQAEKLARSGDLLISEEIANKLSYFVRTGKTLVTSGGEKFKLVNSLVEETPPTPWWVDNQVDSDKIPHWIINQVFEKSIHSQERFLGEIRLTVCMFLKFNGLDFSKGPAIREEFNSFVIWVQGILDKYDGQLLQVIIGDKGDYLYIGFGALSAHEDDIERSVGAGQELLEADSMFPNIGNIGIGIAMGRMFTGPYGSSNRRTYSMIGESANLSARLMEHAENGQILVTGKIAAGASSRYNFNSLEALKLKGFNKAVPVHSYSGFQATSGNKALSRIPLFGRVEELKKLCSYTDNISPGNPTGIVHLKGEGGIGKSRLLIELTTKLADSELVIINGAGYAVERSTPYYLTREILRQLFAGDIQTVEQLKDEINNVLKKSSTVTVRLTPLINDVLDLEIEENDLTGQMSGNIRASNLITVLIELFRIKTRNKAVLIVLDDVHWIDGASWSFIRQLKENLPEIGLILSYRPVSDQLSKDFIELTESDDKLELILRNLEEEDSKKIICKIVGVENTSEKLADVIFDKTSGHPFFTEELTYSLVESGSIVIDQGKAILESLDDQSLAKVPNNIQTAITSRLDRMTQPQQLSIKVASIIGRLFLIRAVRGIHPTPPEEKELMDQMEEITRMNLIARQLIDPEVSYMFKQSIIHDVAYNMLSYSQRYELHQKAALWHETHFANNLSQHYAQLGYHWKQAEVYYKALDYLEKAAYDAINKGAYRDSILFIDQILSLPDQSKITSRRKAMLIIEKGIAYFKIGELDKAQTTLIHGIRVLKKPAPRGFASMFFNLLVQSTRQFLKRLRSKEYKTPDSEKRDLLLTLSRGYEYLAQSYFHFNKLFFSLDAGLTGLNIAETAGPSAQLARAYGSLCVSSSSMPIPGLYEQYARLAISQLNEQIPIDDRGRVLELMAVARSGKGQWLQVESLCNDGRSMAEEIGDRFLFMENTCILAAALLHQGKTEESVKLRKELLEIGRQDKVELVQGWALLQLAEVAMMDKDFEKSRELLEYADNYEEALGQPDKLWLHGLHAKTYSMLGEPGKAYRSADKALALSKLSLPTSFFVLEGYDGMMTAFSALIKSEPGNRIYHKKYRQALNSFGKYAGSFPIGMPRLHYWKARITEGKNKHKEAYKHFRKGLAKAKSLNMILEEKLLKNLEDVLQK